MKKIILILFITVFVKAGQAQTFGVPDTLIYLQTLVANKSQFIGQPFSKLADSLKLQIKYFSPTASLPYDMTKETSTTFAFYYPGTSSEFYLIYPYLEVYWHPFLNGDQSNKLFRYFGGVWTPSVKTFYSTGVVADIKMVD
ncbi:MAG: hypothetical protein H7Y86_10365 [Rhizobacter sp.]|nr:hypothetical protein [Ferruginibacter sp.]